MSGPSPLIGSSGDSSSSSSAKETDRLLGDNSSGLELSTEPRVPTSGANGDSSGAYGSTEADSTSRSNNTAITADSGGDSSSGRGGKGSNTEDEEKVTKEKEGGSLATAFLSLIVVALGNRIFGRLETYPMHNYPLFMNILSVFMYIPMSFAYIIPTVMFTDIITKEQLAIPQYKFMVMGFLDSIAGIMAVFATNFIPNASMIVLVQQSAIPISMMISYIWLAARYTKYQYIGAAITLLGIVVVLVPDMIGGGSADETATPESKDAFMWYMILVASCVPMCFSSVYKEMALGEVDIDVVYLNGWIAVYQFIFAIPLCIPSAWVIGMKVEDIMPNMYHGWLCYLGENSILEDTDTGIHADDCKMSMFYVSSYLGFNLVYNILMIVILKIGSANILWLASTAIVPVSNVAFSLKIMPGNKPMKSIDFVSLFIVMLGLVVYRFMPTILQAWYSFTGEVDEEMELTNEKAREMVAKTERKQTNYIGLNQMEALNAVFDTRVMKARDMILLRSPQQIRSSYLVRLGIAPSPLINVSPRTRTTPSGQRRASSGPNYLPNLKPHLQRRMSEGKYIDALKTKKLYQPASSNTKDDIV